MLDDKTLGIMARFGLYTLIFVAIGLLENLFGEVLGIQFPGSRERMIYKLLLHLTGAAMLAVLVWVAKGSECLF